ncbi:DUF983 domain-containing protein [Lacinutrix sp. WUR7]|uniref:DUF983 domain-containing protein n=1 Tax=Lacinutrix sp. WUR7 TaxID=2653681 RepID=UPI00193DDA33|nr:DUF983 domain-containing protein [Lacinutrix sp. WUR7]QRM88935.1 DUF983 domain-containing protein [Lacinutrix sp. WUR7]
MSVVVNALSCKCPNCKKGNIFNNRGSLLLFKIPKMSARCKECDFKFEREPGFFFGAMFVSYALAVAQMIASLIVFWYFIDLSPLRVFLIITLIALLLGAVNYRVSRSIWIYLFY